MLRPYHASGPPKLRRDGSRARWCGLVRVSHVTSVTGPGLGKSLQQLQLQGGSPGGPAPTVSRSLALLRHPERGQDPGPVITCGHTVPRSSAVLLLRRGPLPEDPAALGASDARVSPPASEWQPWCSAESEPAAQLNATLMLPREGIRRCSGPWPCCPQKASR
jgi:hypothetical protein